MLGFYNVGVNNNNMNAKRVNKSNVNFTGYNLIKGKPKILKMLVDEISSVEGIKLSYKTPEQKAVSGFKKFFKYFSRKPTISDTKQEIPEEVWRIITNKDIGIKHEDIPHEYVFNAKEILKKANDLNLTMGTHAKKNYLLNVFE